MTHFVLVLRLPNAECDNATSRQGVSYRVVAPHDNYVIPELLAAIQPSDICCSDAGRLKSTVGIESGWPGADQKRNACAWVPSA